MKKYILSLIFLFSNSTMFASEIVISDQKADMQAIIPAQKATPKTYTEYLDQQSFTAFHPHELDPELAVDKADGTEPVEKSLYGRFNNLPIELQIHISQYLRSFKTEVDPTTGTYILIEDAAQKRERQKKFNEALKSYQPSDFNYIKDCLRINYWNRYVATSCYEKSMFSNYTFPSFFEIKQTDFKHILDKSHEKIYPKNEMEIVALIVASKTPIVENIISGKPLLCAIKNDNVPIIRVLTQASFIRPYQSYNNDLMLTTSLHVAAENNALNAIRYFHRKGHDLNAQDKSGRTPLHLAYYFEKPDAVTLLIALGARTDITNENGNTPLQGHTWATRQAELASYLDEYNPPY